MGRDAVVDMIRRRLSFVVFLFVIINIDGRGLIGRLLGRLFGIVYAGIVGNRFVD